MCCLRSALVAFLLSHTIAAAATAGERTTLDCVAFAVDGAESSHGNDMAMWRPDPTGPQGPMQVGEAAATDVGGGDRFESRQNRSIGRAYLAQLYWRYGNWPDAIAAYNWGIGKMDAWVRAGRPADKFLIGVAAYLGRVLSDSGLCDASEATWVQRQFVKASQRGAEEDPVLRAACADVAAGGGAPGEGRQLFGVGASRFYHKLDKAMLLVVQHAPAARHR